MINPLKILQESRKDSLNPSAFDVDEKPLNKREDRIQIRIHSPEEIIWKGEADSVSSINSQGPFDILYSHANFITIIDNQPIVLRIDGEKLTFNFYYAVIHAQDNNVKIFAHV